MTWRGWLQGGAVNFNQATARIKFKQPPTAETETCGSCSTRLFKVDIGSQLGTGSLGRR